MAGSSGQFSAEEIGALTKYFIGNTYRYRENIIIPRSVGPIHIKSADEKRVEAVMESCAFKSFVASVLGKLFSFDLNAIDFSFIVFLGYGLGAAIGLFSASVSPNIVVGPDAKQQTVREIFRDLRFSASSYGKNFAVVGLMFSAVECTIESVKSLFLLSLIMTQLPYQRCNIVLVNC